MIHMPSLSLRSFLAVGTALGLSIPVAVGGPVETGLTPAVRDHARYQVTFVPLWNPATNPKEYPYTHALKGILTPVIGATHDSRYTIFAPGKLPTPGLERLSEMGKHDPLDSEIEAAIEKGTAGSLIRFGAGSPGLVKPAVTQTFEVQKSHSLVSLVGMIAPSPDWFYGVSSVQLCEDGNWVATLSVPAFAWDSGGDAGTTYLAKDADLQPKQPTQRASMAHFGRDGKCMPVGYFIFQMVPQDGTN